MDAKRSIWLRNSAWHLLDHQIKLDAGSYRVLNPRRIDLFSQKLQNLWVFGVIRHFVYREINRTPASLRRQKEKALSAGFEG
jgi:hypothetical protein